MAARDNDLVTPMGFESPEDSGQKPPIRPEGGAKSGALSDDSPSEPAPDPELAAVVAAWPTLAPAIRAGIVAMVKAGGAL